MEMLDCGDHSCNFAQDKSGQRTNGGCRCLKTIPEELRSRINYTFHGLKKVIEGMKADQQTAYKASIEEEREKQKLILQNRELRKVLEKIRDYIETDYPLLSRAKEMAQEALTEKRKCDHKWAHIEDHHVICEKCKHVADLCWTCEREKTKTRDGGSVCVNCNPQ